MRALAVGILLVGLGACSGPSVRLEVSSTSRAFTPSRLRAPSGQPLLIEYRNDEPGAQHNISVYPAQGSELIAAGDSVVGPNAVTELQVPALEAGSCYFQCDIHPFMNRTLLVGS